MQAILLPLRHSAFRRVWLGQLVNIIGDAIFAIAIALYLVPRPDAASTIGLVLAASALGGIVSLLFAGALADRHRRSRLIIVSDLIRAGALATIIVLGPEAPQFALTACAAVLGIGSGLYRPAYMAMLPTLVPTEALPGVNALRTLTGRFSMILGGLAAGVLSIWFTPRTILVLDLITFAVSVVTLIGVSDVMPRSDIRRSLAHDVAAGFGYIIERRWILAVMLQGMVQIAVVAGPVSICLPLLLVGKQGIWYGLAVSVEAVGAMLGATVSASRTPRRPGAVAMLALLCQTPQLVAIALQAHPAVIVAFSGLAGVGLAAFAVLWTTALQNHVAPEQLGRVFAMDQLTATGLSPVGLIIAGWLIATVGISSAAWVAAGVLVVSVIAVLPVAGVITFRDAEAEASVVPR
ncbi:MFS transporter [Aldersonia sp. NBC_00410]|uniref:MFS transporter n=1 Tax=Aldersonia sp. NBC_00410 TaxID=2975954 RepID=UPI00225235C7|nr:MFS transporter [Aldersonia sp. NBC_00410]MCX5046670.1 MFS transporter [Aldersonia sp. NBC_00410]